MTPGRRSGLAVIVMAIMISMAAACGSGNDPEVDSKMTPEKAKDVMRQMAAAVMDAAVPDEQVVLPTSDTPIPCGGLEGSSYSKVKYGLTLHSQKALDNADEAFRSAAAQLEELGYQVDPVEPVGTTMVRNFHGDAAGGSLIWHGSGPLTLDVETECLENPRRDEPNPGADTT